MPSYFGLNVSQSPQNIWSITVIYFLVCCSVVRGQTATPPNGDGTSALPYLITNLSELYWISSNNNVSGFGGFNTKYFKLVNDIDASATSDPAQWPNGWIAIGNSSANAFKGNFDGNGKSINGLHIVCGTAEAGLFGYLSGAVLNNFTLNVKIKLSSSSSQSESGALAGTVTNGCSFTDVHVRVTHSLNPVILSPPTYQLGSSWSMVGGFVGRSDGTTSATNNFTRCSVVADTLYTRCYRSGGFVGSTKNSQFSQCYADVRIFDVETYTATTVSSNYVKNTQWLVGGFAGYVETGGSFEDCYVVGEINGWHGIHGFAGTMANLGTYATRCFMGAKIKLWSWDLSRTTFNTSSALYLGIFQVGGRGSVVDCIADQYAQVQAVHANFYSGQSVTTMTTSSTLGTQQAIYQTKNFVFPTVWSWDGLTNNGYPFLTSNSPTTIASNISTPATSYTLPPSQTIQVLPGVKIEVGTLNLNGSNLVLNANSSSYSQLKFSSLSGSGGIVQENYISSGAHMISSSVASGFTNSSGDESKLYSYNAATGAWNSIGSSIGTPGMGYFANVDPSNNPFISAAGTSNVSGTPNTSNTWTISNALNTAPSSSNTSSSGWNLLGNPYTCGLDFSNVYSNNSSLIENSFYIWDATAGGGAGGYLYYSGGGLSSAIIPPMQAFWVQAKTSQSGSITTTMSADGTVASSPTYYKTRPDNLVLHAALLGDTLISDRMWVAHVSGTTSSFDGAYDAWKMTNGPLMPNIYSYVDAEGIAINALDLNGNQIIPVGFDYVDVGAKFRITLEQVTNGQVYQVYLEDKALQQFHDLNQGDYPFTHQVWTQEEPRFALHVSQSTLGTEESDASPTSLVIYQDGARLMVHWYDSDQVNYRLVTVDGKEVSKGAIESGLQSLDAPVVSGVYILELAHPHGIERQKFLVTY